MADENETRDEDTAVAKLTEKVKKKAEEPRMDPDGDIPPVSLDDDEDTEPSVPSRKDKRRQRYDEARTEAEQAKQTAATLQAQLAARDAELAAARAQAYRPQQQPERDEAAERVDAVRQRKKALLLEHDQAIRSNGGKALGADVQDKFEQRAHALDMEMHEIATERVLQRHAPKAQTQTERFREAWMAQNADVFMNHASAQYFRGAHMQARAMGAPDTFETAQRVLEQTRKALRLGGTKPTETERSRYTGVSGGKAGAGSGGDGGRVFQPTKADLKMARARYPGLPDKEALKNYGKTLERARAKRASEKSA